MKRVIFFNRYFFPDHSATSQMLGDLAFHLADRGREVHVVTGDQLYERPNASLPDEEVVRGVRIHRVSSTRFGRSNVYGRGVDYLSLYASLYRAASRLARPGDILVAKTDPPMLSALIARAARRRHACLVNWLQDLYPEVATHLGVPLLKGALAQSLVRLRNRSLKPAIANVVLGERMAARVRRAGVPADKIRIIHNWADDHRVAPAPNSENPLRREWGLEGKFIVGYSGNLGRAHEFETLLDAADRLRGRSDIAFLFIGGGRQTDLLKRLTVQRGLAERFVFQPYQARDRLSQSLSVPDVHWISLRPELEGLIVPSKLYGVLAAGRPVIVVSALDGEMATIVEQAGCGVAVKARDGTALAAAISALADSPERCRAMGVHARRVLEERYSRARAFAHWEQLLNTVDAVGDIAGFLSDPRSEASLGRQLKLG